MMSRKAGKLSGGERKMLAMGRVLMLTPSVLVLDEPTANLAPLVATQLLEEYIRGFADSGSTVLLVEQRAKAALRISDWTLVLGGGRWRHQDHRETLRTIRCSSSHFLAELQKSSGGERHDLCRRNALLDKPT